MKILMVLMDPRSGMFQYAVLLANALAKQNEVVAIVPKSADETLFDASVTVRKMHVGDTKLNCVINWLHVPRAIAFLRAVLRERADVIHFHNPYVIWMCPFLPLMSKQNIVLSMPDGALHPAGERWDKHVGRRAHLACADSLIVLSEHDKRMVEKEGITTPAFVIPHGENSLYQKYARDDVEETVDVMFFGGIIVRKGLEYLLRAVPIVTQRIPGLRVTVAGPGDITPFRSLLDGLPNVALHNRFIEHEEVAGFFQRSKMVVLPYLEEVFSGVVPMAYSFGKPVIVTDMVEGDVVEAGQTGLVVPARDERALAEAIIKLLEDEGLRRRMGETARTKVQDDFGWDHIAAETVKAYECAIRSRVRALPESEPAQSKTT